jgi:hypothetical protein
VRQRGGFVALALAACLAIIGAVLLVLPGGLLGVIGFLFLNFGLPLLLLTGIPAVSGTGNYLIAILGSAAMWWGVGHFAAIRASRNAIVDWPEWRREFQPLAIGIWAGTVLALAVTALVLGAL